MQDYLQNNIDSPIDKSAISYFLETILEKRIPLMQKCGAKFSPVKVKSTNKPIITVHTPTTILQKSTSPEQHKFYKYLRKIQ